MSAEGIGKKFVELCKEGKNEEAIKTLYSKDVVSVEAVPMPGFPAETKGLEAVAEKGKWWTQNHEIHGAETIGPFPNGDQFAVYFWYDVTNKEMGKRFKMDEVALYTVANDKIVKEVYFYPTEK